MKTSKTIFERERETERERKKNKYSSSKKNNHFDFKFKYSRKLKRNVKINFLIFFAIASLLHFYTLLFLSRFKNVYLPFLN